MELLKIVLCSLCVNFVWCKSESYNAAVVDQTWEDVSINAYLSIISEAAKSNVDLLMLPTPKRVSSNPSQDFCTHGKENYDEIVQLISAAAKDARIYVVASLYEEIICQDKEELIRSTVVFDRKGTIVSNHRKPTASRTKCNIPTPKVSCFSTDFGVNFGVIMEDDLILNNENINGLKNLIVTYTDVPRKSFLFAKHFPSSWAFVNNANLISTSGVFGGGLYPKRHPRLVIAKFRKSGSERSTLVTGPPSSFPGEDLSQYIIRPLNMEASLLGYADTVCHGNFCCQFFVKTSVNGTSSQDVSYGLVAFDGIYQIDSDNIGVQTCSVVACAGLYKRSCFVGSEKNTTNLIFDEISITGNFTKDNSAQYPTALATRQTTLNKHNLKFTIDYKQYKHVAAQLYNTQNILSFGIIGRDYTKDFRINNNTTESILDFSEYISSENVQEFFDYVWIRLRVVIFIVSVYILEMM